jgi:hypothetical protein
MPDEQACRVLLRNTDTRWSSHYMAYMRMLEDKEKLMLIDLGRGKARSKTAHATEDEWLALKEVCRTAAPLANQQSSSAA